MEDFSKDLQRIVYNANQQQADFLRAISEEPYEIVSQ